MAEEPLRRYTDLHSLIYLLTNRAITLLDPSFWEDTNDSFSLSVYKTRNDFKTLLALCFAKAHEKYHHWHVFARGNAGVCIAFRQDGLVESISRVPGVTWGFVEYLEIAEFKKKVLSKTAVNLPFIKRWGFKDEEEFRVIYEDPHEFYDLKDISIPLSVIDHIEINPWIPENLFRTTRDLLRKMEGVENIKIVHSQLIDNRAWKELARNKKAS